MVLEPYGDRASKTLFSNWSVPGKVPPATPGYLVSFAPLSSPPTSPPFPGSQTRRPVGPSEVPSATRQSPPGPAVPGCPGRQGAGTRDDPCPLSMAIGAGRIQLPMGRHRTLGPCFREPAPSCDTGMTGAEVAVPEQALWSSQVRILEWPTDPEQSGTAARAHPHCRG